MDVAASAAAPPQPAASGQAWQHATGARWLGWCAGTSARHCMGPGALSRLMLRWRHPAALTHPAASHETHLSLPSPMISSAERLLLPPPELHNPASSWLLCNADLAEHVRAAALCTSSTARATTTHAARVMCAAGQKLLLRCVNCCEGDDPAALKIRDLEEIDTCKL